MDHVENAYCLGARQSVVKKSLKERRLAMGYSPEELAVATGLTVKEIEEHRTDRARPAIALPRRQEEKHPGNQPKDAANWFGR
jgi:hypothetical protein